MLLTMGMVAMSFRLTKLMLWGQSTSCSVALRTAALQFMPQAAQNTEQCALPGHIAGMGFCAERVQHRPWLGCRSCSCSQV